MKKPLLLFVLGGRIVWQRKKLPEGSFSGSFWSVGFCSSLVLTLLSFSASNDIHNDYISREPHIKALLENQELPDWTSCRGDWLVLRLDFFFRIVLLGGLVFFALRWLRNKSDTEE